MGSGAGLAGEADDDPLLRPTWEETEDETDADLGLRRPLRRPAGLQDRNAATDAWRARLLPLCAATDLLARLDARAEVAASRCWRLKVASRPLSFRVGSANRGQV